MQRAPAAVVIADYDYGDVCIEREIIEKAGFALRALQCRSEDEVIAGGGDAVAVMTQYARIGARSIAGLPRLRHIARYGVGVDIVDVEAATRARVLVTNVPADYCRDEVADHALAMLLFFARRLRVFDEAVHRGEWRWQAGAPLRRLSVSRLGIVGLGNIGGAIAKRAAALVEEIVAFDPYASPVRAAALGVELVGFEELLEDSDYVVIQAPLTDETRALFDGEAIARMKPGAVLINTARGPIVDTAALYDALRGGRLAGAALDDLDEEPAKRSEWRPDNRLLTLPNCLVTPHVAYYSDDSIRYARTFASEEVVRVLRGERPRSPVNLDGLPALAPAGIAGDRETKGGSA
jgi:D-3-phosphoglycerate dehydrogenase / 2-oxoglutarate reductase